VSDSEVKKLIESGQVGFPAIERAFINMTSQGGKFAGMMAAQSKTTNGLFSTLKDTIGEVFLTLGTPINDAIRPMVEQAISLVQKLAPLAAEAGTRVRDAMQWVIALFKSGQVTGLIASSLQLGFAASVNFLWAALRGTISATGQLLIEVFRSAITLFQVVTTADFWKGMGNALIGIFLSAIGFLQKGLAEALEIARPLAELLGQGSAIDSAQSTLRESAGALDAAAADRYSTAGDQLGPLAAQVGERMQQAGEAIAARFGKAFSNTTDVIDTTGLRDGIRNVLGNLRDSLPKPGEVATPKDTGGTKDNEKKKDAQESARIAPIVSSLARLGGGGFGGATTLDAQRENNRLTGETNRLLNDLNRRVDKLRGGSQAAFG
jgi:hypothetical protein